MWTRSELKSRAKAVLRVSYWKAFLVSLLLTVIAGGSGGGGANFNLNFNSRKGSGFDFGDIPLFLIVILVVVGIIVVLVFLGFRIFVGYPLEVGGRRYFVQSTQEDVNMNYLGFAFKRNRYMDIIKTMLWRALLNSLWFLLFIIPGFVKMYAYSLVPYILADNPNIGYRRAVQLSNQMTRGHKFRMWVLDLSFIGWLILGAIAFLVGTLFVIPYINATKAELYVALRQSAIEEDISNVDELNLNPPVSV